MVVKEGRCRRPVPRAQLMERAPGPPSSHSPLFEDTHVSRQTSKNKEEGRKRRIGCRSVGQSPAPPPPPPPPPSPPSSLPPAPAPPSFVFLPSLLHRLTFLHRHSSSFLLSLLPSAFLLPSFLRMMMVVLHSYTRRYMHYIYVVVMT